MGIDTRLTRKDFLAGSMSLFLASAVRAQTATPDPLTTADLASMARAMGFTLAEDDLKAALATVVELRGGYAAFRNLQMANSVAPSFVFRPEGRIPASAAGVKPAALPKAGKLPASEEDIAFLTATELAALIRSRQLTARRLTEIYIRRIERLSPKLLNVISLLAPSALAQADVLDAEASKGKFRGPLHGLPYGLKDLFASREGRTTWGAAPYKDQRFDFDSAVVERLEAAGAILLAKTSVGALAMDDHWFGGKTKNPWNTAQGSSGSSAGSASGLAAGLFAFAIGTETLGSIMSPSHRCRVTGLRPTFGRVSRHGAMALSWTMDKVGPIGRTAADCGLVLSALVGHDPRDAASVDKPLRLDTKIDPLRLKIAFLTDDAALDEDDASKGPGEIVAMLRAAGATLEGKTFRRVGNGVDMCLSIEAAAAFEGLTLGEDIKKLENSLWPGIFRGHLFSGGVGYVQAMRARSLTMKNFEEDFGDFDVVITSDRGSYLLFNTNLTGHPQLYIPLIGGRGISLIGRLYDEAKLIALGNWIQAQTQYYRLRPDLSKL
ncbi:MAG: amidase [Chthonomonas sp.]|nr:amidase [Chthonomonas sp.]